MGEQKNLLCALDWTSLAGDKQWMLSLNIVTAKGISTPLLWKTIDNQLLKHNRARYEDQLLSRLKDVLPKEVNVTLVADRGFADHKFFHFLAEELNFNYIIRIKANTFITHENRRQKAMDWLSKDNRPIGLKNAQITLKHYAVQQVVNCYAKRWRIEPYFRDLKDGRFGYGLRQTHIHASERRDRLMLIVALAYLLLVILGQAGEQLGFDKKLKVNTVKTRTHSLFRQGQFYYEFFIQFTTEEQEKLMETFQTILSQHTFWCDFFGNQQ